MWGQVSQCVGTSGFVGIIPTRVGTSHRVFACRQFCEDHPHACGDKYYIYDYYRYRKGSSPRVWGQAYLLAAVILCRWIIPTRVGTSPCCRSCCGVLRDHPHACGDKTIIQFLNKFFKGSSPRVWGQECLSRKERLPLCIIPTRVGTRGRGGIVFHAPKDHPHACGDKPVFVAAERLPVGSSPRVWGQECSLLYGIS